jgi:hypothetical protein
MVSVSAKKVRKKISCLCTFKMKMTRMARMVSSYYLLVCGEVFLLDEELGALEDPVDLVVWVVRRPCAA